MEPARVRVAPAGAEHAQGLSGLFERADVACHCRYFHFPGTTNAWLDRCANQDGTNRAEMAAALEERSPEMMGVVALGGPGVVGWLKLAPASAVPKLYDQRIYRHLPCFSGPRDGVLAVGCLLVDPAVRGRGVAHALIAGAIDLGRSAGASAIEAFPRRAEGTRPDEIWTGPFAIFTKAGFEVVHDFAPYPVLRLALR